MNRKKSLTILNVAALGLAAFTIGSGALALLSGGREVVEEHFNAIRLLSYAGWSVGLLVLAWAGSLAAGLGRPTVKTLRAAWRDRDLIRVKSALLVAFAANAVVLAASPLGAWLGDYYSWNVFEAHLALSLGVAGVATFVCLLRLRSFVDDIAPAPIPVPSRAKYVEPAGF